MKDLWKGVVVGSAVLLLLFTCVRTPSIRAENGQRRTANKQKRVDELYNKNCARCHGADGRSDTPLGKSFSAPDFTKIEWWQQNPALTRTSAMRRVIVRGKGGMPAFGKKLTATEINLLVERIKKFRNTNKTATD